MRSSFTLEAPSGVSALCVAGELQVRWSPASSAAMLGVTAYKLLFRTLTSTRFTELATVPADSASDDGRTVTAIVTPPWEAGVVYAVAVIALVDDGARYAESRRSVEARLEWQAATSALEPALAPMVVTSVSLSPTATTPPATVLLPTAPRNVLARAVAGGVQVTWDAPTIGAPLTGYVIVYKAANSWIEVETFAAADARSLVVQLPSTRSYVFAVGAYNTRGYGARSAFTSSAVTPLRNVPAPTGVRAQAIPGAVRLIWSWVGTTGVSLARFDIYWRNTNAPAGTPYKLYTAVSPIARAIEIGGLLSTSYTFMVQAVSLQSGVTIATFSSESASVIPGLSTRGTAPRIPRWQPAEQAALLVWEPPTTMPTTPTEYMIYSRVKPAAGVHEIFREAARVPGNTTAARVTGLVNATTYEFRIQARYSSGLGPANASLTSVVPQPLFNYARVGLTNPNPQRDPLRAAFEIWSREIAFDPQMYATLRSMLPDWNGLERASYSVIKDSSAWWWMRCGPNYISVVRAGGFIQDVPVSYNLELNTWYGNPTIIILAHELGHALGIGVTAAWADGITNCSTTSSNPPFLTGFTEALRGYNAENLARHKSGTLAAAKARIPLEQGVNGYGQHWSQFAQRCGSVAHGDLAPDVMSYSNIKSGPTHTSVGALLDLGWRLVSADRATVFRNNVLANARTPINLQLFQAAPKLVMLDQPEEIEFPQSGQSRCQLRMRKLGTLYLDGDPNTDASRAAADATGSGA